MNNKRILILLILIITSCNSDKGTISESKLNRIDNTIELADSCYNAEDFQSAINYYNKLIAEDTMNGEFYYKRGFSLIQISKHKESSADLTKSIELKFREADSYYLLGLNEIVKANDSLAIIYIQKSLELNPLDKQAQEVLQGILDSKKNNKKTI